MGVCSLMGISSYMDMVVRIMGIIDLCMCILHVNLWAHILPHAPLKITYTYVHVASGLYCCSQTMPMRFNIDDISKKTKHHATECSRYLVELDKVHTYVCYSVFLLCKCLQYYLTMDSLFQSG